MIVCGTAFHAGLVAKTQSSLDAAAVEIEIGRVSLPRPVSTRNAHLAVSHRGRPRHVRRRRHSKRRARASSHHTNTVARDSREAAGPLYAPAGDRRGAPKPSPPMVALAISRARSAQLRATIPGVNEEVARMQPSPRGGGGASWTPVARSRRYATRTTLSSAHTGYPAALEGGAELQEDLLHPRGGLCAGELKPGPSR